MASFLKSLYRVCKLGVEYCVVQTRASPSCNAPSGCNAPAGCNARMGHRDPSAWGAAWRSRGTLGIQSKSFAWPDQTISDCCIFHWLLLLLFKHFTGSIKNCVWQSPDDPQVSMVLEDIVWYCMAVLLSDWYYRNDTEWLTYHHTAAGPSENLGFLKPCLTWFC